MKILWVSLVEFQPLSVALGKKPAVSCGWVYSSLMALKNAHPEVQLGVIVYSYENTFKKYEVNGINYYMVPSADMTKCDKRQVEGSRRAIEDFMPDIIHIHGTEYSLAEAVCRANTGNVPTIANIQGLAGPYTRYSDGGLSIKDMLFNITPLDFYRSTFLLNAKRSFRHRAKCEDYVLRNVSHVVGRTRWDKDQALAVNPKLKYLHMEETLRSSFYEAPVWSLDRCKKHRIFVSNSGSPLKGAHQVLKALPLILSQFPDTEVHFCGSSVMNNDLRTMLHMQGYHLYLRRLVKRLKLQENVKFLGQLSEAEMKQAFLDANVYVLPSSIENSPNSLCEAQILGVPVIASYVGGVPTLVEEGVTGYMYRYEEIEMLAAKIIEIFQMSNLTFLSEAEMAIAEQRHDRVSNAKRLYEIYTAILSEK